MTIWNSNLGFGGSFIKKNFLFYIIVICAMLLLLNQMAETSLKIRTGPTPTSFLPDMLLNLWGFLFGILIEWKGLKQILKLKVKVNFTLLPALFLTIISFIPRAFWFLRFGVGDFMFIWLIAPLRLPETQIALNILAGILLVRSLTIYNEPVETTMRS